MCGWLYGLVCESLAWCFLYWLVKSFNSKLEREGWRWLWSEDTGRVAACEVQSVSALAGSASETCCCDTLRIFLCETGHENALLSVWNWFVKCEYFAVVSGSVR